MPDLCQACGEADIEIVSAADIATDQTTFKPYFNFLVAYISEGYIGFFLRILQLMFHL